MTNVNYYAGRGRKVMARWLNGEIPDAMEHGAGGDHRFAATAPVRMAGISR